MSKSLVYLCILTTILFSCRYNREDKHPEIPYFPEISDENYEFESIDYFEYYIGENDTYIYSFSQQDSTDIIIYNKDKVQIASVPITDDHFIDESGSIYQYIAASNEVYKYKPPSFEKVKLDTLRINESDTNTIENIDCLISLGGYEDYKYILKYGEKEYYTETALLQEKKMGIISNTFDLEECTYLPEKNIQQKLEQIDDMIQSYSLQGSNHIALGISTIKLYYYQLIADSDTLFFKSNYDCLQIETMNDDIVIQNAFDGYYVLKRTKE